MVLMCGHCGKLGSPGRGRKALEILVLRDQRESISGRIAVDGPPQTEQPLPMSREGIVMRVCVGLNILCRPHAWLGLL